MELSKTHHSLQIQLKITIFYQQLHKSLYNSNLIIISTQYKLA